MRNLDDILAGVQAAAGRPRAAERQAAAAFVHARGLPRASDEAWKYTSLAPLQHVILRPAERADAEVAVAASLAQPPGTAAPSRVVFVNGYFRADLSQCAGLARGVAVRSLAEVMEAGPDVGVGRAFDPAGGAGESFAALNEALLEDGLLIDVARGARMDDILHVVFVATNGEPLLRSVRLVVRMAENTSLRLLEEYVGQHEDRGLTNIVTDIELAAGAILHHHRVQNEAVTAAHIGRVQVRQLDHSEYHSDSVVFGGALTRVDIETRLAATGARCRLHGLFTASGNQHVDHHTLIDHAVADTHSVELYRGILDDQSRGVFNGKVIVRKDAQRITARQASNNLLLSRRAEIDTKPELEIYADDVSCAHGATVGELDPAALFYLRSRGIGEAAARALLTYAFAEQIVETIPVDSLRDAIERRFLGDQALSELKEALAQP